MNKQKLSAWYKDKTTVIFLAQLDKWKNRVMEDLGSPNHLLSVKRPNMVCAQYAGNLEVIQSILNKDIFEDAVDLEETEEESKYV